jgi:hypothetical protein
VKKAITILLISGAIMVVVAILAVSGMIGLFKSNVVRMKEVEKVRNVEIERMRALPELRGVVVSSGRVRTPFSKREVALYALTQGRRMHLSGPTGGRSSGPSQGPRYVYEDDVVLVGGTGLVLAIDSKEYTTLPDSAILFWRADGSPNSFWAQRSMGEKFESNLFKGLFDPEHGDDYRSVMALKGRSGLLDRYISRTPDAAGRTDVYLEELLFEVGDTLIFKGRIEEGRIVPLF